MQNSWEGFKADSRSPRPYIAYAALLAIAAVLIFPRYPFGEALVWMGIYAAIFAAVELLGWVYAFLFAPRSRR